MSLPRYPEYKDSEVAWLGQVPSHWTTKRLKHLFEIRKRIAGEEGHAVLSITQRGIKVKDLESNDGQLSMDYSKYQFVEPGDFAMNHMDLLTGFVDISSHFGVTSPDYRVFSVREGVECDSRFFLYLLQNGYRQRIFYAFGQGASEFGRWRFATDQFNDFRFPYPPSEEQTAITTFLDRETGKIDALISEQEKLLTLLAEKRQATISHAVTKGLNPDVPMKDSGVEWLGEVPAHWGIIALKRICDVRDGTHDTPIFIEPSTDTYPLITTKDLLPEKICFDEAKHISAFDYLEISKRSGVDTGDIIMPMIGSIGGAVMVETGEKFAIKNIALFKFSSKYFARWLQYILNSSVSMLQFELQRSGGVQSFVGLGTLRNLIVPLPDLKEQTAIATFLDCETAKLDTLKTEAEHAISLLKERRNALISAAVTGKIDVRQAVAEEVAA